MAESQDETRGRSKAEPTRQQVYDLMAPGEPFTVTDIVELVAEIFDDRDDVADSKWTLKRRLDGLHDDGRIHKKEHNETLSTYWRPPDRDTDCTGPFPGNQVTHTVDVGNRGP